MKDSDDPRPEHLQKFRKIAKRAVELATRRGSDRLHIEFITHAVEHHQELAEEVLRQEQRDISTWRSVDSMRIAIAEAMEVKPETLPGHEASVYSMCMEMIRLRKKYKKLEEDFQNLEEDFQNLHDEHTLDGVVPPKPSTTQQQLNKLSEIAITHANTTSMIDWVGSEKLNRDDSVEKRAHILMSLYHRVSNSISSSPDPTQQESVAAPIDILNGTTHGDADDIACAFAAALLTAGFDCYIVAHGYGGKPPTNALVKVRVTPWPSANPEWRYLDVAAGRVHKHTSEIEGPLLTPDRAAEAQGSRWGRPMAKLERVVDWVNADSDANRSFVLDYSREYSLSTHQGDSFVSCGRGKTIDEAAHNAMTQLLTNTVSKVIAGRDQ